MLPPRPPSALSRLRRLAALFAAAALLTGCGASHAGKPDAKPASRPPAPIRLRGGEPAHIAIILMENEEYPSIIGASQAPFITALARRYAVAGQMYATTHPSLPNYLALTGGSTFGVSSDCTDCSVSANNLATQLARAGVYWKAYMEGLPHPCFTGASSDDYAKKHDPFVYYRQVSGDASLCAHVVPLLQLKTDERAHALPRFIWITPNLCHDMHDCSVATGDRFLAGLVPGLLRALGSGGLLFLTWDEGTSDSGCCRVARGGHIATILAGDGARRGARLTSSADQYSILQAVEDLLGLPRLRYAACACTPSLRPLLAGG
jgi:phosphatidylinositol-3-phosphatase